MYTILLVDDEPLVLVGLQSLLDWEEHGYRLVGTACNGKKALELLENNPVDIVITDIRMPVTDGLELMGECSTLPDGGPVFIVLTSFEEFSYAREALKKGAVDYLVKLELNAELLLQTLNKAALIVPDRNKNKQIKDAAYEASVFIDRVFLGLLNRSYRTEEECSRHMKENSILFEGSFYIAAVCNLIFPVSMAKNEDQVHGYYYAVNMLRELLNREFRYHILALSKNKFLVLAASDDQKTSGKNIESALRNSLSNGMEMIRRYFDIRMLIGIGSVCTGLLKLADSYSEAIKAQDCAVETNPVRLYSQLNISPDISLIDTEFLKERFSNALLCADTEAIRLLFTDLQQSLRSQAVYYSQALDACIVVLYILMSILDNPEETLNQFFSDNPDGYRCLYIASGITDVCNWLAIIEEKVLEYVAEKNRNVHKTLAESIKKYIDQHYREKISLGTLAEIFNLSPNYVGTVFKKQQGIHFNDYLAQRRIEAAKELLQSGRYKIYTVSEQMGFENQYYFSKVFKKYTGKNPKDYLGAEH